LFGTSSKAWAINDAGQVVGSSGSQSQAFLWDSQNGMRNLNNLLDPTTGAGWVITGARGINAAGQIVGTGTNAAFSRPHALLLTPVPQQP
jgi:probable HAF family extracellular repeat protein